MRVIAKELNSRGHEIYTFKVGREQMEILHSLCERARRHMPHTLETECAYNRINAMIREINRCLKA